MMYTDRSHHQYAHLTQILKLKNREPKILQEYVTLYISTPSIAK